MKIAVISDIHSNADALKLSIDSLKSKNVNLTVFLGDILSYGCQPFEVIEILTKYSSSEPSVFIKGNHDQFYFDLQAGVKNLHYNLPKFVQESVEWTFNLINTIPLNKIFKWYENYTIGNLYFSHANLYKYGNWSYVENRSDLQKSFIELTERNLFAGIFGHSHRQFITGIKNDKLYQMDLLFENSKNIDHLLINAGSVGQPRGMGIGYLILEILNNKLQKASFEKINLDFRNSINLIQKTKLSQETKKKLIGYLET